MSKYYKVTFIESRKKKRGKDKKKKKKTLTKGKEN
jgi:hypothetical protein